MSPDEVKNTLAARRPDGRDDTDPVIAAALAAARRDPALAALAERERASDAALAAALRDVAPPPGLREAILAGRAPAAPVPVPVVWWRSARGLALAAGLALVAGLGVWQTLPRATPDLATLAAAARAEYATPEHAPLVLGGGGRLRELLADPARPLTAGLDLDFAQLRAAGCRRLQIAGIEVLEICFTRGETDEYHLYIARRGALAPARLDGPLIASTDGVATATWTDAEHAYVLLIEDDPAKLRAVL